MLRSWVCEAIMSEDSDDVFGGFYSTGQMKCGLLLTAVRMGMFVTMQITSFSALAETLQKHSK